jgi:hypothetical protein
MTLGQVERKSNVLAGTGEVYFWERGFVRCELELELEVGLGWRGPKLGVRCLRPEQQLCVQVVVLIQSVFSLVPC